MNAEGVINSVLLTSMRFEFLTCFQVNDTLKINEQIFEKGKERNKRKGFLAAYIKNLQILIFLLDQELLIELFNEVDLLVAM